MLLAYARLLWRRLTLPTPAASARNGHTVPPAAAVYIAGVVVVGAIVLARAAPHLAGQSGLLPDMLFFAVLVVLADFKKLRLSYNMQYSVATALNFAAVLVLGPAVAVWSGAGATAIAGAVRRKPWYQLAFNVATVAISVTTGGQALVAVGRGTSPLEPSMAALAAIASYALVNSLVNHVLVCVVVGLTTRSRPWEVALANLRGLLAPLGAQFPVGILIALAYVHYGKVAGLGLLVVPVIAIYGALEKAQQLREHTRATLEALADTIDRRDRYTAEHSQRVAAYADQIAAVLGLPLAEREIVVSAARVHDLGKIATPDHVLRKTSQLEAEEWRLMREHAAIGASILDTLPMYRACAQLVRYHHERLDGLGYPDGLAGVDVPQGARILSVADAFDAMTSDRPYRRALPVDEALARLRAGAGTQFSPEVVEALATALAATGGTVAPPAEAPLSQRPPARGAGVALPARSDGIALSPVA